MNKSIPADVVEAVARAICVACEENPDHQSDARGNIDFGTEPRLLTRLGEEIRSFPIGDRIYY